MLLGSSYGRKAGVFLLGVVIVKDTISKYLSCNCLSQAAAMLSYYTHYKSIISPAIIKCVTTKHGYSCSLAEAAAGICILAESAAAKGFDMVL